MNEQPWVIKVKELAEEIFGDISGGASSATEHTAQGPSTGELLRASAEDGNGQGWEDGDEEDHRRVPQGLGHDPAAVLGHTHRFHRHLARPRCA